MRGRQGRCAWRSSASTWTSTPPRSTLARRSPSSGTSRARTASAARAASRSRAWPSRSSPPVTEPSAPAHDGDRGRGAAACVPQRFATQVGARSPARSQTTQAGRVGDLLLGDPIRLPLPLRKRGKMISPSVLPAARSAPARRNRERTRTLVVAVSAPVRDVLRGLTPTLSGPEAVGFLERTLQRQLRELPVDAAAGAWLRRAVTSDGAGTAFATVALSLANLAERPRTATELHWWL